MAVVSKKRNKKLVIALILVVVIITIVLIGVVRAYKIQKGQELLDSAAEYIRVGDYKNAESLILDIEDLKLPEDAIDSSIKALFGYVKARANYDPDSFDSVDMTKTRLIGTWRSPEEFKEEIEAFREEVSERYDYFKWIEYAGTVLYVGMEIEDEEQLIYSDWGKPVKTEEKLFFTGTETYYVYVVDEQVYSVNVHTYRNHSSISSIYEGYARWWFE